VDYTEAIKAVQAKVGGEWTDINTMFNRTLDDWLDAARRQGRRGGGGSKLYREQHADVCEAFAGEWTDEENPVLQFLPDSLTAEAARTLAHLVASRKPAALYLALLVHAKRVERPKTCDPQEHETEEAFKACRVCNP